jgi:uncharacterized protein
LSEPNIEDSLTEAIRSVLRNHGDVLEARIFGSRAKGTARPESDVDIAIFGQLDELSAEAVAEELGELPLPYRFDVLAYASIRNRELKEHIDRVGLLIYRQESGQAEASVPGHLRKPR